MWIDCYRTVSKLKSFAGVIITLWKEWVCGLAILLIYATSCKEGLKVNVWRISICKISQFGYLTHNPIP